MISSEDEFGAVGYLAPRSPDGHKTLARQFSVNDSGIVDLHGSRYNSRLGLAIPNHGYGEWDENSDPRTPTSTHAFFQRTNSHPPLGSQWTNQQQPLFLHAPEKYMKVPDYEELPNSTRHPDDPDVYTPIDEGSVCVTTEKKPQNGTNVKGKQHAQVFVTNSGRSSRLRTNPLYDHSPGPFVVPYYPPPKDGLCIQRSCCLQTFAFLFSLVAFLLVLWSLLAGRYGGPDYQELVKDIEDFRSNLSKLYQMVKSNEHLSLINDLNPIVQLLHNSSKMLEILSDLEVKVASMSIQVNLQETSIQNATTQIATQTDQINFLKSQESRANETFENLKQLSIGAKHQMQMRGLANMSACSHSRKSYGRSSSFDYSITDPLDLSHVLVLGVLCTTKGGTEALLVDQAAQPSDNNSNYTCICHGKRGAADQRYCTIHYWTCPILS